MNRILLLLMTSLLSLFFFSCEDNKDDNVELKPVSNITNEQKPEGILFKWDNPEATSYVEISFKNDANQENVQRILVQSPKNQQLIMGLPDTSERAFSFTAYRDGKASPTVAVQTQASKPPFSRLANTVQVAVVPNQKKLKVSWNNQISGEYVLSMFINNIKVQPDYEIVIKTTGEDERLIYMPETLFSADLFFTVKDTYGNESQPISKVYQSISESGWFDRSLWTIADISSEHAGWLASFILDGKFNTFWASYLVESNPFPHYLTFDLKRKVVLTKARLMPGNTHSKMLCKIQGSSSPHKNSQWTDIVSYSVPNTTANVWQEINFPEPVTYRYIRLYCASNIQSGAYYAVMAEFALFGHDVDYE